jgi:hypothetical protein
VSPEKVLALKRADEIRGFSSSVEYIIEFTLISPSATRCSNGNNMRVEKTLHFITASKLAAREKRVVL